MPGLSRLQLLPLVTRHSSLATRQFMRYRKTHVTSATPLTTVFALGFLALAVYPSKLLAQQDPNQVIVSVIQEMPRGGGYLTTTAATRSLQAAVRFSNDRLAIVPENAQPSYCSGATYLVFVRALERLNPAGISGALASALAVRDQPDGSGVWGRWNANGPGTACLFRELQLGHNFTSFEAARPGDFLKIFWTSNVGRSEHGHSVVYLGQENQGGVAMVRFWSSNKPVGFSDKVVPRSRIAYAIFSRLEYPTNVQHALSLPTRNSYLAGLVAKSSSLAEASSQCDTR
jgi:hypothetical protein